MGVSTKYLVTVDRDCRQLFLVDPSTRSWRVVAELEQRLAADVQQALTPEARAWNRGLKTVRAVPDGYVVCDIFGVYRLDHQFHITQYLSIPEFTDIHSALPYDDRLLISNTGADQILWIDWQGQVLDKIDFHRWFPATPWMAGDLDRARQWAGDLRKMPLDWARESCHVNWAEQTPLGIMASCFIQGAVYFFQGGQPVRRVAAHAKLHAPRYLPESQTVLFTASEENRVVEIDLDGNELWSMNGFKFAKYAERLPNGNIILADTGHQRVVEIDPAARCIEWECAIPGTPYAIGPAHPD